MLSTKILDLLGTVFALAAAWLWFRASGRPVRRLNRTETLDAADMNRIVVAINRAQKLNERAAFAAAVSALCAALRFAIDAVVG